MRRALAVLIAAAALLVTAGAGSALAAGQVVCVGGANSAVLAPNASGGCAVGTPVTLATESEVTALQSQVATLQSDNATLSKDVSALQSTLSDVTFSTDGLNGKPTLTISGANVQIDSGARSTEATPNGLGNLFIGYDENPSGNPQTGSNNLILGENQTFMSFGGILGGEYNRLAAPFASAFGYFNTASGSGSSVPGGAFNTASGPYSSVPGGNENTASKYASSVLGGVGNTATADGSSVLGGGGNTASGFESSVLGGFRNTASGGCQSIPATNTC
jgi:hypothetical protein